MRRRLKAWGLALLTHVTLSSACTTSRALRPVGAKQWQGGGSVGGPVFTNLGAPIPTPLLNVYGRYGLTEKATLHVVHRACAAAHVLRRHSQQRRREGHHDHRET